jgi:uncharacterized membrane protein YoaT (DUF817 family)
VDVVLVAAVALQRLKNRTRASMLQFCKYFRQKIATFGRLWASVLLCISRQNVFIFLNKWPGDQCYGIFRRFSTFFEKTLGVFLGNQCGYKLKIRNGRFVIRFFFAKNISEILALVPEAVGMQAYPDDELVAQEAVGDRLEVRPQVGLHLGD